jgi:hypothetical protein
MLRRGNSPTPLVNGETRAISSCMMKRRSGTHRIGAPSDRESYGQSHVRGTLPALATSAAEAKDEMILSLVLRLNSVCKAATLHLALTVGELVIKELYAGDIDRWRSREPRKQYSMRKLARHPDLAMSPSALFRSIAIYEVCERLGIRTWKHVSSTHIRMVLPLPPEEQLRLLRETEANKWSARRLEEEAIGLLRSQRARGSGDGGRRRGSALTGAMRRFEKQLSTIEKLIPPDDGSAAKDEPSPDSARAAMNELRVAREQCTILENRLERRFGR